jgi:RHH-type proline utilization regulon transcriptional repressor/proline dehydrogenase/delta 1-pyrroline-5-carboxylate dehydrogenase
MKTSRSRDLVADPVDEASRRSRRSARRTRRSRCRAICMARARQFDGLDLSNEHRLASLSSALLASAHHPWRAAPMLADNEIAVGTSRDVRNPADHRDLVGTVVEATSERCERSALARVAAADLAGDAAGRSAR